MIAPGSDGSVRLGPFAGLLEPLLGRWLQDARTLRRRGCDREASVIESVAQELRDFVAGLGSVSVTLQEASELSGYSSAHLGRLVREGTIPNAGRQGSPRISISHIPRRPVAHSHTGAQADTTQIVQSIIDGDQG